MVLIRLMDTRQNTITAQRSQPIQNDPSRLILKQRAKDLTQSVHQLVLNNQNLIQRLLPPQNSPPRNLERGRTSCTR
jgi:hypothetical protein